MSLEAASKHIRVLERTGLVRRPSRDAATSAAVPVSARAAQSWLRFYERFWNAGLNSLEEMLAALEEERKQEMTRKRSAARRSTERVIPASPGEVYRAWLNPISCKLDGSWRHDVARAEVEARVGGRFRIWHADTASRRAVSSAKSSNSYRMNASSSDGDSSAPSGPPDRDTIPCSHHLRPESGGQRRSRSCRALDDLAAAMPHVVDKVGVAGRSVLEKLAVTLGSTALRLTRRLTNRAQAHRVQHHLARPPREPRDQRAMAGEGIRSGGKDGARAQSLLVRRRRRSGSACRISTSWSYVIVPDQNAAHLQVPARATSMRSTTSKPEDYKSYADEPGAGQLHPARSRTDDEHAIFCGSTSTRCARRQPARSVGDPAGRAGRNTRGSTIPCSGAPCRWRSIARR